jgi:cyanophycin synthetase
VVNSLANVHVGGENVDVTELVHPDLMTMAVDAVRSIPGLGLAGVDLQTPDVRSPDGAVVLEANVGANIRVHNCPAHGFPRDVAGAIVDEMIASADAGAR